MAKRTMDCPIDESLKTGRAYVSPCCTSSITEFLLADGRTVLCGSISGHGWGEVRDGTIDDIYDAGTFVEADGTETYRPFNPGKMARIEADMHRTLEAEADHIDGFDRDDLGLSPDH